MSDERKKIFHGYAQDGIEPLKSMMPQLGSRGTPPLSSAMPKAPAAPVDKGQLPTKTNSGSNYSSKSDA